MVILDDLSLMGEHSNLVSPCLFCVFFSPGILDSLTPGSLQEAVFSVKASCADGYYGTAKVTVQVLVGKSAVWTPVDSCGSPGVLAIRDDQSDLSSNSR